MENESSTTTKEISGKPREINLFAWYGSIAGLCGIILFATFSVMPAYLEDFKEKSAPDKWRPGKIGRLEEDLVAINRDGKTVNLGMLEGKVYVVGHQYTDCPGGCLGMAEVMKELLEKYKDEPRFHLVSISANPADDTPEKMDAWVKDKGVESDKWWFLTGDEKVIRKYVVNQIKMIGSVENTEPEKIAAEGKWSHDLRLFIVDEKANIRGFYGVMHPEGGPTAK